MMTHRSLFRPFSVFSGRSGCLSDSAWIGGWIVLVLVGQVVLSVEVPALEWLTAGWLWAALVFIRPLACIPLLIVGCSTFLCENHRAWAWVLPVAAAVFLVRILLENRLTLRQYLLIFLAGTVVLVLSWPRQAGALLLELRSFPLFDTDPGNPGKWGLIHQWLRPSATWAVFPFRQAADRAVAAGICAGAVMSGRYFSSHRIWTALWVCALIALVSSGGGVLIPWHQDHLFLGTTNFGAYKARLFMGAGYSVCFLTLVLIPALPLFFSPLGDRFRNVRMSSTVLLLPTFLIFQRAYTLALLALLVSLAGSAVVTLARARRRRAAARRWREMRKTVPLTGLCVLLGLWGVGVWFLRAGGLDSGSRVRRQMIVRVKNFLAMDSVRSVGYQNRKKVQPGKKPAMASATNAVPAVPPAPGPEAAILSATGKTDGREGAGLLWKLERRLTSMDRVRGHMWILGVRRILADSLWIGHGAGTWARFHRNQPRPTRIYFAHMHNTVLDLMFEYGLVPTLLVLVLVGVAVFRILLGVPGISRIWLGCFLSLAAMGMGQFLLFTHTGLMLLLPFLILIPRALTRRFRRPEASAPARSEAFTTSGSDC